MFLDDVQLARQSWQTRNRIAGPNGPVMVSLPVARKPAFPLIREAQLAERPDNARIMARIHGALGTAPHWPLVEGLLTRALERRPQGLAEVTITLIQEMAQVLDLAPRFHRASALGVPGGDKAERLLAICRHLGADLYLSPQGSVEYLSLGHPFTEAGVRLRYLNYEHPVYAQRWKPFQDYMSALDAIAWVGAQATRALILDGIAEPFDTEGLLVELEKYR